MTGNHDKKLIGRIIKVKDLDNHVKQNMFALMDEFYFAKQDVFFDDLSNKNSAILLHDADGILRGFTSAKLFDLPVKEDRYKILFSGDTIIHPDFWGTLELPRIWGKFMLETLAEMKTEKLYWFLISSGYKTYRFLPAYFHNFYPRHDQPTPEAMQLILDAAAEELFGSRYDADKGIIKMEFPTPLKGGVSDPTEERLRNPHISFFLRKNPGYVDGDELACLTQLTTENIKPFVKRLLRT